MKRLRGQGWIADFDTGISPRTGHYLTPRGYLVLVKFGKLRAGARFRVERYSPFIFRHRTACARVGLALERHPLVREFLPESLLWRRREKDSDKLCDAEFWYEVPGHEARERVGLEVELTLKNKDKLEESFQQLSQRELDQVWWLCGDKTTLKALRCYAIDHHWRFEAQRHFFCLFDDFVTAKHQARMVDAGGKEFTIDPEAPTLLPRKPHTPPPPEPTPSHSAPATGTAATRPLVLAAPPISPEHPAEPDGSRTPTRRRLARLGEFAKGTLAWLWRWVRESWSVYECYDGNRILNFHRWPHVCAAAGLGVALVAWRAIPTLTWDAAAILNPPPPTQVWQKRRPREYGIDRDGWILSPRSLKSSGNLYQFKFGLANENSFDSEICAASIQDTRGRTLASRTWREVSVQRGRRLDPDQSFEFSGPRGMDRFFVVISDNLSGCGKTGQGKSFLVQFD